MGRTDTKAATRAALLEAALAEFAEKGLDTPSLDGICARAGYTRGAFYVHFADRDALLAACMEDVIGSWVAIIAATTDPAGDFDRTVRAFADAFAALTSDPAAQTALPPALVHSATRFHLVLEACQRSAETRRRFADTVGTGLARIAAAARAAQAGGSVRADLDADATAVLFAAVVFGLLSLVEAGVAIEPARLSALLLQLTATA